jgi:molybdopterin converting factor subunit 1
VSARSKDEDASTIRLKVLYFAYMREIAGIPRESIFLTNNSTLGELMTKIRTIHPRLLEFNFKVAVNKSVAGMRLHLKDGDEIALIPPVTGG